MNHYTKYVLITILIVFAMFIITHCLTKLRVIEGLEQLTDDVTNTETLPDTDTDTKTLPDADTDTKTLPDADTDTKTLPDADTPIIAQPENMKDVHKQTTMSAAPYVTTTVSVTPPSLHNTQPIGQSVLNTPQPIKQPAQNAVNSQLLNTATNKTPGNTPAITKSAVKTKNF
jgi:hypothetical protein